MLEFELRPTGEHFTLSGGQLEEPLRFPEPGPDAGVRLVGLLSQKLGSTLRIFDADGKEAASPSRFEPVLPRENATGRFGRSVRVGDKR